MTRPVQLILVETGGACVAITELARTVGTNFPSPRQMDDKSERDRPSLGVLRSNHPACAAACSQLTIQGMPN
jgi:hypothetical protein